MKTISWLQRFKRIKKAVIPADLANFFFPGLNHWAHWESPTQAQELPPVQGSKEMPRACGCISGRISRGARFTACISFPQPCQILSDLPKGVWKAKGGEYLLLPSQVRDTQDILPGWLQQTVLPPLPSVWHWCDVGVMTDPSELCC